MLGRSWAALLAIAPGCGSGFAGRTTQDICTVPVNDDQTVRQAPCARSDLLDHLRNAIEERGAATLHTKKSSKQVEEWGESVRSRFSGGTTADADMVLGRDGIHSSIRNRFIVDTPVFSRQITYRGVIPTDALTDWPFETDSLAWLVKYRHVLALPITRNIHLNIVAFVTKSAAEGAEVKERWTSICDRRDVLGDLAGFDEPAPQGLNLLPEQPSKWSLNGREPLDRRHYMGGKVSC